MSDEEPYLQVLNVTPVPIFPSTLYCMDLHPKEGPQLGVGVGTGLDVGLWDQSESKLPPTLNIDSNGWLNGYVDPQVEDIKVYEFRGWRVLQIVGFDPDYLNCIIGL